jgi:hypothetical protein
VQRFIGAGALRRVKQPSAHYSVLKRGISAQRGMFQYTHRSSGSHREAVMAVHRARNGFVELAYEVIGAPGASRCC